MLRLQPTVISLTASEVKDAETRRRFRRHLKKADAQQTLERKCMEQNRESPPRGRSSSASTPRMKDGPEPIARRGPDEVLASSPPQSPVVPVQQAATPLASPEGPDRRGSDDQGPKASNEPSPPVPRLLAMTPRRLPPALLSASSLRRGVAHGRSGGPAVITATAFAPRFHRDATDEVAADSEVAQQARGSVSPSPDGTSPTLPPPFSQTSRQVTADYPMRRFANVSHVSDSEDEEDDNDAEASGTSRMPPVTPIRRSSLSAASGHQAISDNQGGTSLTNAAETAETGHRHARYRSVQSSTKHTNNVSLSTSNGSSERVEAEASTSSPSVRMGRLQIYNDSLPPSVQPETPQNLPEARHQSRLRGSYTVPARRDSPLGIPTPTTSRRWQARSGLDPTLAGLQTPGFLGLYGGIENSDEVQLFEQAERELEARLSRMQHSSSFGF